MQSRAENVDRLAVHESGHAVMYFCAYRALGLQGPPLDRVLIRKGLEREAGQAIPPDVLGLIDGRVLGLVHGRPLLPDSFFDEYGEKFRGLTRLLDRPPLRLRERLEWTIMISLAGPVAEAVATGVRSDGGDNDYRQAKEVLAFLCKVARRRAPLRLFEDRTREIARQQWAAIEALSARLSKAECLDHRRVHAIVARRLHAPNVGAPLSAPLPTITSRRGRE